MQAQAAAGSLPAAPFSADHSAPLQIMPPVHSASSKKREKEFWRVGSVKIVWRGQQALEASKSLHRTSFDLYMLNRRVLMQHEAHTVFSQAILVHSSIRIGHARSRSSVKDNVSPQREGLGASGRLAEQRGPKRPGERSWSRPVCRLTA